MMFKQRGRPRHPDVLTPREWEVLNRIREGHTNARIAELLAIAPETVKYHVSEILSKLQVPTREAAAAWQPEPAAAPRKSGVAAFLFGLKAMTMGASATALAGVAVLGYGVLSTTGGDAPTVAEAQNAEIADEAARGIAERAGDSDQITDRPEHGPDYSGLTTIGDAYETYAFAAADPPAGLDLSRSALIVHYGEFVQSTLADADEENALCRDLYLIVDAESEDIIAQNLLTEPCPQAGEKPSS